jgi:N-methylhydantoinase A
MVHGTTVGINAFLERRGARVLLLTTAGVRDSYTIARGDRVELYRLQYHKPARLVPRRDVHEVRERVKWDGTVIEPLHEEDLVPVVSKMRDQRIEAVAVCFLHAYAHPAHETRVREILAAALPGISVTLSHEVAREWREYERASTAVMNAYIAPAVDRYLSRLVVGMRDFSVGSPVYVMQSSGGIMTAETARREPIRTLLSGPVGGAIGAVALAETTGLGNLVCVDMGGTSFDMSLVVDGRPTVASSTDFEGLPLLTPIVDVHTIGAGGGSIAWIEAGGLRVGPRSAGADPGPACYGRGGKDPTVTDAHLFLNRIGPDSLLGGRMRLDETAAACAIHSIAGPLGLEDVALAEGILAVANARMADAMRTITVARGIDPREFSLVAYGGAGPMHAVWLARELAMTRVIIPKSPGTFSAAGMLRTNMRHDLARNFYRLLSATHPEELDHVFAGLIREGREALTGEGVRREDMLFHQTADMRYVGQEYSVSVPINMPSVPGSVEPDPRRLATIEACFHEAYRSRYGHSIPSAPVEFVTLRVAASGLMGVRLGGHDRGTGNGTAPVETDGQGRETAGWRQVVFDGEEHTTMVLQRVAMEQKHAYEGPLVIEEDSATTVVPPGCRCGLDEWGNIVITPGEPE